MAAMLFVNWWLLAFWVVVLAGLIGGKVYQQHARWQRLLPLVLVYLVALLASGDPAGIAPRRESTTRCALPRSHACPRSSS